MSRIKAEEILQLCAARFEVTVEEVKEMRAPGWRDKYPKLKPSRRERAQCAALYLIDRHTNTPDVVFLEVLGFKEYHDLHRMVEYATREVKAFEFDVSRIEESIDRIHELRTSLEGAKHDCSQVSGLRGKVFI